MNCEWVEEQLSAYHDHALDTVSAARIEAHLASCSRCQALLREYTLNDRLIASLPRYEPRADARARLFASPDFQALLQERAGGRAPATTHIPLPLSPTPITASSPAPTALRAARLISSVAAVLLIVVGAVTVFHNISAKPSSCVPIASGAHLVARANHTLRADGLAVLCDQAARVGGLWRVSPDGHLIAYQDTRTGDVMVTRANGAQAHSVWDAAGQSGTTLTSLLWSPDGSKLAIIGHNAFGTLAFVTDPAGGGWGGYGLGDAPSATLIAGPVWSPDSTALAFAETITNGAIAAGTELAGCATCVVIHHDILTHGGATPEGTTLSAAPGDTVIPVAGPVGALAFSGPQITWTVTDPSTGAISAIATGGVTPGQPARMTLWSGATPATAASFDATRSQWAVALANGAVVRVAVTTGMTTTLAHLNGVTALAWSPDGARLAAVSAGALWLIDTTGTRQLALGPLSAPPAWSPDGVALAFVAPDGAHALTLASGHDATSAALAAPRFAGWSPDGQRAAFWDATGTLVVARASGVARVTTVPAEAPQWSLVP